VVGFVDFHNHLIPGVDDGASSSEESRLGLAALRDEGVSIIVTTPHIEGSLTRRPDALRARLLELDSGWKRLRAEVAGFRGLTVHRGCEVMLDTPEPDLSDVRVRLAGTRFVLVEFPHLTVPPRSAWAIAQLCSSGWYPIIAHPERYSGLDPALELVSEWKKAGGLLQVNGASLLGRYGLDARRNALGMLERGWADFLCSDYHGRGHASIQAYREVLIENQAEEQADMLMKVNPARMLNGEQPLPMAPVAVKAGFWQKLGRAFR
jgi:protein-tyrosine phosphatase